MSNARAHPFSRVLGGVAVHDSKPVLKAMKIPSDKFSRKSLDKFLARLIRPARERMANAAKKRRKRKNELLGIEIRQTQLEGECKLIARQIAADKCSLSSMTNQSDYLQVQHRIHKDTKSLEIHQCALAAIPMQTYAAEQAYLNSVNDSAEMAIAITDRIPRMRSTTITLGTEVHEQAGHLLDQLDFDAMNLLEDMMKVLEHYEHKTEKSSLEAAKDRKIMLLEQEKSKLQSELNKMKKRLKSMRKTMESFMAQAKIATSAPVKDLLSTMRAMLDSEEADEPKMTTERAEASQSRSNQSNDSRQPQHQLQNETAQPRGTNTNLSDVPKAPTSSTRSVAPAPPRNEGNPRANPIQRSTRDNPSSNGPAVPDLTKAEGKLKFSEYALEVDSTDSDDTEVAEGFSAANNFEDLDANKSEKKERSSARDGRGNNPESEALLSKQESSNSNVDSAHTTGDFRLRVARTDSTETVLPSGWDKYTSVKDGKKYYANRKSGKSSWTPPPGSSGGSAEKTAKSENSVEPGSGSAATENLPEGWNKFTSATDGKKYYANLESGESSWSKPSEDSFSNPESSNSNVDSAHTTGDFRLRVARTDSTETVLPSGWGKYARAKDGKKYYAHLESGKSSWTPPPGSSGGSAKRHELKLRSSREKLVKKLNSKIAKVARMEEGPEAEHCQREIKKYQHALSRIDRELAELQDNRTF